MMIEQWWQDLRLAWRGLWRAKGFAGTAVLTLAAGITGTTVMFALVQGVLLRPLPVREPDRLLVAWKEVHSAGTGHWPYTVPDVDVLNDESQVLERVAGIGYTGALPWVAVEDGAASYVNGVMVTGDFFRVLGAEPLLGRVLNRADDVAGAENVLVITHRLWQRRYGGSRDVIGRRVTLGDRSFTIVGVMAPDVEYPRGVEAWRTTASVELNTPFGEAARRDVDLVARLRPGATLDQAASELRVLSARLDATAPPTAPKGGTPVVRQYKEVVVGDVRPAVLVLFGAVGLVLLIASANVANLLLMRGEAKRSELAVRAALGATRGRLARQLLAESVWLALAAGGVGLAVTMWGLKGLLAFAPDTLPRIASVRIDAGVVAFAVAAASLTAAIAGLVPALSAARADLWSPLRDGGHRSAGGARRHGRRTLVVAQVAIAVSIVAAAGLLTRSVQKLQTVDTGLAADRLVFVQLELPQAKFAERGRHLQFLNDVVAQLETAPGVAAATPVNTAPFSGTGWDARFTAEGQSAAQAAANPLHTLEAVHPNYFSTFEVMLVRGRGFTQADRQGAPNIVIVSQDVAARTWPGENPVGKRIKLGDADSTDVWRTVVGVTRPTRYRELIAPRATLYIPAEQLIVAAQMLVLRTASPVALVAQLVRDRVRTVDPDVQVMRVARFAELLQAPLARPRFNAALIGVFALAALLLSAIGLYAVMAAYVRQRHREIGIRVALGATRADVRSLVLGEGLRLAGLGAALGLAGALTGTSLLRGLLFDVEPHDPASLLASVLLLVGVSALASSLPAWRATRVDPVELLRAE